MFIYCHCLLYLQYIARIFLDFEDNYKWISLVEFYDIYRGVGTGEADEALASSEFRGFTSEKFLASWTFEGGNFSGFTGKRLVLTPLIKDPGRTHKF